MKKIALVDVSAMYFRAYYAIRSLTNSKGMPTNAIYGFLTMNLKFLEKFKPDYLVYCFDQKDPSFRKEIYEAYKANRSEMPEDLVPQVPYITKVAKALGGACSELKGYEADDIIGMIASWSKNHEVETLIVSGDKDFAQLVDTNVHMYDPVKELYYKEVDVVDKWGVEPNQIIDYLSLVGDSSDNIPGVRGVGPKGAEKLLKEYKNLDNIFANISKIKNKNLATKLSEGKEQAYIAQKLVSIVREDKLGLNSLKDFEWTGLNHSDLKDLLLELDFKSLHKKLYETNSKEKPTKTKEKVKFTIKDLKGKIPLIDSSYIDFLNIKEEEFSFDSIKSFSKDEPIYAFEWGTKICLSNKKKILVIESINLGSDLDFSCLNLTEWQWCGFNLKSIWRKLKLSKVSYKSDLQLAKYTFSATSTDTLDSLLKDVFEDANLLLEDSSKILSAVLFLDDLLLDLLKQAKTFDIYQNIELPLSPILLKMENTGICLDIEELDRQKNKINKEIESLSIDIKKELNTDINLDSPKQLSLLLFEEKKMPVIKKTKTGYSTDSDVLEKLSKDYPVCKKIIEYRELKKLVNTYLDALPKLAGEDKKIHTYFNQAVTATGRLSSSHPNLQNIPIRSEKGNAVRKAFIASEGSMLIAADYSQIELRVLAHITDDPGLVKAFNEDLDIHSLTASEVFGVSLKDVDSEMRRRAKAINFGIAYGMGAYTLAENLNISRSESKEIIEKYFKRFKNVKEYMSSIVQKAKEDGFVESVLGRRRYIPELFNSNQGVAKFGERIAINSPIQSSASDIVKKAMIVVDKKIICPLLLQVHDELLLESPNKEAEKNAKEVVEIMENIIRLKVPLKVNVGLGKSWQEAH